MTVAGVVLAVLGIVVALLAVIVIGHRMIGSEGTTSVYTDGMGSIMNVFDPARERADEDLRSHKQQGEVLPTPDDGYPVEVDLKGGVVRFRKSGSG